eukprot:TRINITY_DN52679_c3_g1_i1.p2 TRINITY_DN52679_c3_g1~~TRINITY_DN52679_c3_g1_i1.p2  ORF type:complete len:103 (-),score=3.32 TRINITY_DN52679_c3_g1_i1:66-374(-)
MMSKKKEDRPADAQTVLAEVKQLLRQVTNKEAAPPEAAFRASRSELPSFKATFLERPWKRQLGWLALTCFLAAASMAGVGWAMRSPDPMLSPITNTSDKVKT